MLQMDGRSTADEAGSSRNNAAEDCTPIVCEVCRGFGDHSTRGDMFGRLHGRIYFHYPSLVILKHSADGGCPMCQVMLNTLAESDRYESALAEAQRLHSSLPSSLSAFDFGTGTREAATLAKSIAERLGDNDDFLWYCVRYYGNDLDDLIHHVNFQGRLLFSSSVADSRFDYGTGFERIDVLVPVSKLAGRGGEYGNMHVKLEAFVCIGLFLLLDLQNSAWAV